MALDNFKKTSMRIDKANQRFIDYQNAKVGDVNGRELLVQITNNGVVEDQTGTTLKLNWQHENGNQGSTSFNAVDVKTGKYSLYYPSEMLYKGTVDASVEINSNGQITHTMNFKIIVHADVFNGEAGTVNGVFISLADVNKKLDDREKEYKELKTRQSNVENQFNDIKQEMTGKDVISAPEIIVARDGMETLNDRLDRDSETTPNEVHLSSFPRLENEADDNGRFNRAIASMSDGETLVAKKDVDNYYLTDTIVIEKKINIRFDGEIFYKGVRDRPVFKIVRPVRCDISINALRYDYTSTGTIGWGNENFIGILIQNAFLCKISIKEISGFDVGAKMQAISGLGDSGFWFDDMRIRRILNCRIGYELNSHGGGAWFNANEFSQTSIGYTSGIHKTSAYDRYNIKQTITGGNTYGGNSNYFYNFKFETHGGFSGSHTMVYLVKATEWVFKDSRKEVTNKSTNEKEFVMDMSSVSEGIITRYAHSSGNLIDGKHNFEIEFINTTTLNTSLDGVIKNTSKDYVEIFKLGFLNDKIRRVNPNNSVIRGFLSSPLDEINYETTTPLFYRVDGIIRENEKVVPISASTLTLYLVDVSIGDTIIFENFTTFAIQAFNSSGEIIKDLDGIFGYVLPNPTRYSYSPQVPNAPLEISIKNSEISSLKIKLFGEISDFTVYSDNKKNRILKNVSPNTFKVKEKFYSNIKPVYDENYGFGVGDVVYNTKTSSQTPEFWQLQRTNGTYVWSNVE